jgi:L-ascorbate metabolism protein UlaG (beta-lactamase superfamily)
MAERTTMTIDVKWFPPSWSQIKYRDKVLYIDPAYIKKYFTHYPKKVDFTSWPDPIDGLPEADLEKADLILVTHHHKDHCKGLTVRRLTKPDTVVVAPRRCLRELGADITVVQTGSELVVAGLSIRAVAAYNLERDSSRSVPHRKGGGIGYLLTIDSRTIYHAGDTDLIPEMAHLGPVDVALLPIGGRSFTMNAGEAVRAAATIEPRVVIPIHRFEADVDAFQTRLAVETGIETAPLKIGEIYRLR